MDVFNLTVQVYDQMLMVMNRLIAIRLTDFAVLIVKEMSVVFVMGLGSIHTMKILILMALVMLFLLQNLVLR